MISSIGKQAPVSAVSAVLQRGKVQFVSSHYFVSSGSYYQIGKITESKTALHCKALHCTALRGTALHCTARHCTAQHLAALKCTTLHCTAMHCTEQHTVLHWCPLKLSLCPVKCSVLVHQLSIYVGTRVNKNICQMRTVCGNSI